MTRIARIERAKERGEYTAPGTKPNAMNPTKVEREEIWETMLCGR